MMGRQAALGRAQKGVLCLLTQILGIVVCGGCVCVYPQVMLETPSELTQRPQVGCYIHGLFLEGARWDPEAFQLAESQPKELYTEMAVIWLLPTPNRMAQDQDFYLCPIYKTLTRAGMRPGVGTYTMWGGAQD